MTDAVLVLPPGFRVTDSSDVPISGAKLKFYASGTSTPMTVYSDQGLLTSLGTTVTCDSSGYPVSGGSTKTLIYTGTASYKLVVTDADDVTIYEHDAIKGAVAIPTTSSTALPSTPMVSRTSDYTILTTDQGKWLNSNPTSASFAVTLLSAVTAGDGFAVGIRHTGTANIVTIRTTGSETVLFPGQTKTAFSLTGKGHGVWLVSDGANWHATLEAPALIAGNGLPFIKITDRLTAPPSSPTGGNRYIISGTPTGAWSTLSFAENDVVESDGNGSWFAYTPTEGWFAYVEDENLYTAFVGSAWVDQTGMSAAQSSTLKHAVFQHQETNGTVGGTPTTGAWTKRGLNTETVNTITGASLASGQITLPVGTYLIHFRQEFYRPADVQSRIKVISGTASPDPILSGWALWYGLDGASDAPSIHGQTPTSFGVLTVTAQAVIELQYWVSANFGGTSGLGAVSSEPTGSPEVYARVAILDLTSLQGATGAQGTQGPDGLDAAHPYQWDTGTTAADPGSGKLRLNNATPSSATVIYISDTTSAGGSMTNVINSWVTSTSVNKGRIRFSEEMNPQNFMEYFVTAVSDSGSFFAVTATYINHSGSFDSLDELAVSFVDYGDIGDPGTTVPDISGLTELSEPDRDADYTVVYDTSAASTKKVRFDKFSRRLLTAATTIYVDPVNGNDATTTYGATTAGAFLTIEAAYNYIISSVDLNGFSVKIKIYSAAYPVTITEDFVMFGSLTGGILLSLEGDSANPANVKWVTPAASTGLHVRDFLAVNIDGFDFSGGAAATCLNADQFAVIDYTNCRFGTVSGGYHFLMNGGSAATFTGGTYEIYGTAYLAHIAVAEGGQISIPAGTINMSAAATFTQFLIMTGGSFNIGSGVTISGTGAGAGSTGKRYTLYDPSLAQINVTLPGSAVGTRTSGLIQPDLSLLRIESAGVINWGAGNATLTHATGTLALSSGTKFGLGTTPAVTFHVRTAADHNFELSNQAGGVAIQGLNDARANWCTLDFDADPVTFKNRGSAKLATNSAGVDVTGTAQMDTLRIDQAATAIGTGAKTISNAADSSTNFGKYFSINLNGTTVYVPCSTVAPT